MSKNSYFIRRKFIIRLHSFTTGCLSLKQRFTKRRSALDLGYKRVLFCSLCVIVVLQFGIACGVTSSTPDCFTTLSEPPELGGLNQHLVCGLLEQTQHSWFVLHEIESFTFHPEWPASDTLQVFPITEDDKKWALRQRDKVIVWLYFHDETYTFSRVK